MTKDCLPYFNTLTTAWEYIQQYRENREKLSATDENGNTLAHLFPETAFRLHDLGIDVSCVNNIGETPLMTAVKRGKSPYELLNLTDSAVINNRYLTGDTLLTMYLRTERPTFWSAHFVQNLCEKGIDVNASDGNGRTPISFFFHKGKLNGQLISLPSYLDVLDILVLHGAFIQDFFGRQSYLNERLKRTMLEDTSGLIRLINTTTDKDLFLPDADGNTPLHAYATSLRCDNGVFLGLLKRIDINARNNQGETPLMVRLKLERHMRTCGLVEQLVQYSDVNCSDNDGHSPLHIAVKNIHDNSVQHILALLAHGADVTRTNHQGQKPVDVAISLPIKALLLAFERLSADEQVAIRQIYHDLIYSNGRTQIARHQISPRIDCVVHQNNG